VLGNEWPGPGRGWPRFSVSFGGKHGHAGCGPPALPRHSSGELPWAESGLGWAQRKELTTFGLRVQRRDVPGHLQQLGYGGNQVKVTVEE
jgi:hypothetical protein